MLWDGLFYSLLISVLVHYQSSCYNCFHFVITFKFVMAKILVRHRKQVIIAHDEVPQFNCNLCRFFSCKIIHHVSLLAGYTSQFHIANHVTSWGLDESWHTVNLKRTWTDTLLRDSTHIFWCHLNNCFKCKWFSARMFFMCVKLPFKSWLLNKFHGI